MLHGLPGEMAEKALRFRAWPDAYGFILGKLLLVAALKDHGYAIDLQQLYYTGYGRPYLPGMPDFNISHSGHQVICAVASQGRVGADLEMIKEVNIEEFSSLFAPEEWRTIKTSPTPINTFYEFWTAKESLIKADGRGLNLHLPDIVVTPGHTTLMNGHHWHLARVSDFNGYACCIAAEFAIKEFIIHEIPVNALLAGTETIG